MNKIVGIIQARIGSTRLANKMMLSLHGKAIIEWVVCRVSKSKLLDDIVVAIPNTKEDDILAKLLKKLDVHVFRGNENNVLERFYKAAEEKKATKVVRICADNPLIDYKEIDNLIHFYNKNLCDYAYNHIPLNNKYPDGLGAEIISFKILENLYKNVKKDYHKEHCLSYINDNSDKFTIKTFDPLDKELYYPELKFDIDTFEDYQKLAMKDFDMNISSKELINLFKENRI